MNDLAVEQKLELRIELERVIEASAEDVFQALLDVLGPNSETPDATPLPMKLEPFPGGRWFRDLGDNNGHLWAHVQAIKRPTLLEFTGPLFMSQGVSNNLQYRLKEEEGRTTIRCVHSCFGYVPDDMEEGMTGAWANYLDRIASKFE